MIINDDIISSTSQNNINLPNGTSLEIDGKDVVTFSNSNVSYPQRPGTIIENLWSQCNGSSYRLTNGIFTVQNVETFQILSNVYSDINGSVISYLPPIEATKVVYRYTFSYYALRAGTSRIHNKFVIDDVDVAFSRYNLAVNQYPELRYTFEWIIPIGGTPDARTGRQASWTSPKVLKLKSRNFLTGTNDLGLNGTYYFDGATVNIFNMPIINIIAIK
jgi:hypothetical protein